jgi:hypothetical protein
LKSTVLVYLLFRYNIINKHVLFSGRKKSAHPDGSIQEWRGSDNIV